MNTTPYPTLAQEYNNAGWKPELAIAITPPWLIATVGVIFNVLLVYVTIKNRMANFCNTLIAMDAVFCALSELGYTVSWFVYIVGWNAIDQTNCFYFLFIPSIGYVLSFGAILTIAFERLLAIIILQPPSQVNCNYGDLFLPGYVWTFYYTSVGIVCCAGICYLLIGLILLKRRHLSQLNISTEYRYTRRIFHSLFVIMLLVVGSQLISLIWRITKLPGGYIPAIVSYYQEKGNYCLTYLANTANAPVLYVLSTDYNKAFKTLGRFNIFSIFDCLVRRIKHHQSSVILVTANKQTNAVTNGISRINLSTIAR